MALGAVLNGSPRRIVELGRVLPCELLGRALVGGHQTPDFLEKVRTPLMLIDGEFGTFALVFEGFDFLINSGFIAVGLMLFIFYFL